MTMTLRMRDLTCSFCMADRADLKIDPQKVDPILRAERAAHARSFQRCVKRFAFSRPSGDLLLRAHNDAIVDRQRRGSQDRVAREAESRSGVQLRCFDPRRASDGERRGDNAASITLNKDEDIMKLGSTISPPKLPMRSEPDARGTDASDLARRAVRMDALADEQATAARAVTEAADVAAVDVAAEAK